MTLNTLLLSPINDFPRSTCTFRHLTVVATSSDKSNSLSDWRKSKKFKSWNPNPPEVELTSVTKHWILRWQNMFNGLLISVFESDAGSQVTIFRCQSTGDNDGPTLAPSQWSGPEEFDTNINRSPGPRAASHRGRSSHLHLHEIFKLIIMRPSKHLWILKRIKYNLLFRWFWTVPSSP